MCLQDFQEAIVGGSHLEVKINKPELDFRCCCGELHLAAIERVKAVEV